MGQWDGELLPPLQLQLALCIVGPCMRVSQTMYVCVNSTARNAESRKVKAQRRPTVVHTISWKQSHKMKCFTPWCWSRGTATPRNASLSHNGVETKMT